MEESSQKLNKNLQQSRTNTAKIVKSSLDDDEDIILVKEIHDIIIEKEIDKIDIDMDVTTNDIKGITDGKEIHDIIIEKEVDKVDIYMYETAGVASSSKSIILTQDTTDDIQDITNDIVDITDDIKNITDDIKDITDDKEIHDIVIKKEVNKVDIYMNVTAGVASSSKSIILTEDTTDDIQDITNDIVDITDDIKDITDDKEIHDIVIDKVDIDVNVTNVANSRKNIFLTEHTTDDIKDITNDIEDTTDDASSMSNKNSDIFEEQHELEIANRSNNIDNDIVMTENLGESNACQLSPTNASNEFLFIEGNIDADDQMDKCINETISKEVVICDGILDNVCEIEYDFKSIPYQITGSWKEFTSSVRHNYTRGCKWAPDGSCILTCSDDNFLRIFNLPQQLWDFSQWSDIGEMEAVVKISEGELIYDYSWYPLMNSSNPVTCCLASISRRSAVHLWDGFTGELRCSYRSYNHMDEIVAPHSLCFDSDGQKLFCGFQKFIRIFDVNVPGRSFEERHVFAKKSGQSGIISCFAFTPNDKNISVAGSYHKTIGIYSEPSGNLECLLEGQKGGVSQLQFSPDGTYLYSGGRKDPEILCWDMRNLGTVLFCLRRSCTTNQRMYFDISSCGRYIISGNQNGVVSMWDITKEPKIINDDEFPVLPPIQFFLAHDDCVNGVSFHPTFPLMCTSSGQRKFPALLDDDDDGIFSSKLDKWDNSLRLWWIGKRD